MVSIRKFNDFVINENNENAVLMMDDKLNMLESKLKKIFDDKDKVSEEGVEKSEEGEKIKKFGEENTSEEKPSETFRSLNLESLEKSKFSKTSKSIKLIYSDEEFRYDVVFRLDLKDVATPEGQELNQEGLDNCYVTFKRYKDDELSGQIIDEKVSIDDINTDFFDEMIAKLVKQSDSYEEEEEDFSIELEDEKETEGGESQGQSQVEEPESEETL